MTRRPRPWTHALRAKLGKCAGVTSGVLGILCVLAEFCFLFPELLVTPDAHHTSPFDTRFARRAAG